MKHIVALLLKFGMVTLVLLLSSYLFISLTISQILIISVAVTLLAYLIGDLVILAKSNNIIATVSDFALVWITLFMFNYILPGINISVFDALMASLLISMGEWIFHKYMSGKVLKS